MLEQAVRRRRSSARFLERRDAIWGALDRATSEYGFAVGWHARSCLRFPAGDWPDITRGSHVLWAAGLALLVGQALEKHCSDGRPEYDERRICEAFGVSLRAARQRAVELRRGHVDALIRAELAGVARFGRCTSTPKRMAEELQSVPLPHCTWPWPCDDYTDGVFVAGESPALDAYYAVLDMLETSIETSSLVAWLGAVIAADPDHYDTYLVLRDVLADSGQRAAGIRFEQIAYVRCLSRITMPDGGWPARLTYTELTNRPIMRTLISKAATLWRLKQTDEALDILRRMLKMDPEDRTAAAAHILGMRMGMTQPQFERRFYGEGVEAFVMMDWFGAHYGSFPEEFAERRETVKTEFQEPDWKGQPGEDVADDGGANGDQYQSAAETVN